jgi:hypothetical protein
MMLAANARRGALLRINRCSLRTTVISADSADINLLLIQLAVRLIACLLRHAGLGDVLLKVGDIDSQHWMLRPMRRRGKEGQSLCPGLLFLSHPHGLESVCGVPASTVMSFGPIEAQVMSHQVTANLGGVIDNRNSQDGGYWYDDLKQAYEYPSYETKVTVNGKSQRLDGTGATIGVLMSSDYLPSDVAAVFDHENWKQTTGKPNPTLYADIPINGGGGLYGGAFAEVSIDTQSEITGAPGAHVILYDIPDLSDGSIFAGYVDAIEDNEVDALSASFGECELYYFPSYNGGQDYRGILKAEDELFM